MRESTWTEVLDALEQELTVLEWALEHDDLEPWPHAWQPPSGLGPLSREELERALRLHDRLQSCADGIARRREAITEDLEELPRRKEAAHRYLARR